MIMRIPILKSILRNLDWFEEARRHHVAPDGSIFLGGTNHRLKKAGDWEESKHPRADNGQFGSGSGGSKKPSKTKRKLERRAEAASQGRVSGAIQTLLSGGSALDKIGWLNTSKPQQLETPAKEPEKPKAEEKPKSKLYQEMTARGIKAPPPSKMIEPGSAALQLKTDSGVDIPIKVSGYKQNPEITIDPPFTTKTGLRIAGSGQIITTKVNGKPRSVLKINTTKGPAMLTVDTAQIKGAADKLPEKQYAARKVKETINSDGIPIEIERWNIDGGSRTTSTGRYLNDSELGDFLDSVGIKDISVKDAIALYEQLMETPEKLQRRKEREAASSARMQHFQDMEDMENARR